jgi:hypothetical protein
VCSWRRDAAAFKILLHSSRVEAGEFSRQWLNSGDVYMQRFRPKFVTFDCHGTRVKKRRTPASAASLGQ